MIALQNRGGVTLHSARDGLSRAAYAAVLALRRQGHRVFCAKRDGDGRETHHELDGDIVPTSWLVDLSGARPATKDASHE
jgi:hypothetical protein